MHALQGHLEQAPAAVTSQPVENGAPQAYDSSVMVFITYMDNKMPRWTENTADQNHMDTISSHIPVGDIVHIVLKDGTALEGVFRRMSIENNGGEGGWKFRGECEIETKDHTRHVLDYLDIRSASSVWNDPVSAQYQKLGLITLDHRNPTQ